MSATLLLVALLALAAGVLAGWLVASRGSGRLAAELAGAQARVADAELLRQTRDAVERERNEAFAQIAAMKAQAEERQRAHEALVAELKAVRESLPVHFRDVAAETLEVAQRQFLERANERFRESEELARRNIGALIQPVTERLQRYEEGVAKVEAERRDAFGDLKGQIEAMRIGQESVRSEAARLVNALRSAPKARGRWGEQQLRNVLETCGLAEHTDFMMEVSVGDGEGGRLRPDAVVKVPGGRSLVIDAKVSLNAYQDAHGAADETERAAYLTAHVASMKRHVDALGAKAYQQQFEDAPDYVVMFVPGEHFLAAALEHAPDLWDYAFDRRVLIATPTNLIAIARTVAAVWRQEKLAGEAREIATLGKELHARLATMGSHVAKLGRNLEMATGAYNAFVGSLESQVLTQAKRFESLNIDTGNKAVETLPVVEQAPRPLTKLAAIETDEADQEAAE